MRGMSGISHERDILMTPALIAHGRELNPRGTIGQKWVSAELRGKDLFAICDALFFARALEPSAPPALVIGLDDDRRCSGRRRRRELIRVDLKKPVLVFAERECKCGESL